MRSHFLQNRTEVVIPHNRFDYFRYFLLNNMQFTNYQTPNTPFKACYLKYSAIENRKEFIRKRKAS